MQKFSIIFWFAAKDVISASFNAFFAGRQVWETSGRQVQTHAAQGTQSGRQVWETSVGDKRKTSVNSCGPRHPSVRNKWETCVKSCGPRHPEWETSVGDKCGRQGGDKSKLMRPKARKCEGQVGDKYKAQGTKSGRQVRETSGRQV